MSLLWRCRWQFPLLNLMFSLSWRCAWCLPLLNPDSAARSFYRENSQDTYLYPTACSLYREVAHGTYLYPTACSLYCEVSNVCINGLNKRLRDHSSLVHSAIKKQVLTTGCQKSLRVSIGFALTSHGWRETKKILPKNDTMCWWVFKISFH